MTDLIKQLGGIRGQMIVFPIKQVCYINNIRFCVQCGCLFNESEYTKDHGICSLECGYKLRGLHWSDFLESPIERFYGLRCKIN